MNSYFINSGILTFLFLHLVVIWLSQMNSSLGELNVDISGVHYGVELIVPSVRRAQGKSSLLERNDGIGLSHGFVGIFARQWNTDSTAKVCQNLTSHIAIHCWGQVLTSAMNCYVRSPEQMFVSNRCEHVFLSSPPNKKIERCIPFTRQ